MQQGVFSVVVVLLHKATLSSIKIGISLGKCDKKWTATLSVLIHQKIFRNKLKVLFFVSITEQALSYVSVRMCHCRRPRWLRCHQRNKGAATA